MPLRAVVRNRGLHELRLAARIVVSPGLNRLEPQRKRIARRNTLVAIGRALLADPAWVNRLRDGALDGFNGYNAEIALSALT